MGLLDDAVMLADLLVAVAVLVPAALAACAVASHRVRQWLLRKSRIGPIENEVKGISKDINALKHRQYALIVTRHEPENLDVEAIREENDVDLERVNQYLRDDRYVLRTSTDGD